MDYRRPFTTPRQCRRLFTCRKRRGLLLVLGMVLVRAFRYFIPALMFVGCACSNSTSGHIHEGSIGSRRINKPFYFDMKSVFISLND
jgi:hypothetical protein